MVGFHNFSVHRNPKIISSVFWCEGEEENILPKYICVSRKGIADVNMWSARYSRQRGLVGSGITLIIEGERVISFYQDAGSYTEEDETHEEILDRYSTEEYEDYLFKWQDNEKKDNDINILLRETSLSPSEEYEEHILENATIIGLFLAPDSNIYDYVLFFTLYEVVMDSELHLYGEKEKIKKIKKKIAFWKSIPSPILEDEKFDNPIYLTLAIDFAHSIVDIDDIYATGFYGCWEYPEIYKDFLNDDSEYDDFKYFLKDKYHITL